MLDESKKIVEASKIVEQFNKIDGPFKKSPSIHMDAAYKLNDKH